MQTHLRPMSLGEILDRTAQLYRTHFALFAGISALYAAVILALNLGQIGLQQLLEHLHMSKQVPWVTLGYIVLIFPLILIFGVLAVAANNRAVAWVNLDQPATIRGAYRSILPRLGRYIGLTLLMMLIIYTPYVVVCVAYGAYAFVYAFKRHLFSPGQGQANPQSMLVFGLVSLVFGLILLGVVVYIILMTLRYSLAITSSVIEDLPARRALKRSIDLTKGARGRIFVLALLIVAIEMGLVLITQIFFIVDLFKHGGILPVGMQVAQQVVGALTNAFIGPMYATGLTLFYYDQRIRKEGFDIEWMMQAAGMTAPPAAPPGTIEAWPELPAGVAQNPEVTPSEPGAPPVDLQDPHEDQNG